VDEAELSGQIDDAIDSIAELERKALASASLQQRAIERFTLAIGRPRTIPCVLLFVVAWIALNGILVASGRPAFDRPPFVWLVALMQLAALLMTVIILTTENRMSEIEEQRSRLHLQISILAEQKTAKIIELLEELRAGVRRSSSSATRCAATTSRRNRRVARTGGRSRGGTRLRLFTSPPTENRCPVHTARSPRSAPPPSAPRSPLALVAVTSPR